MSIVNLLHCILKRWLPVAMWRNNYILNCFERSAVWKRQWMHRSEQLWLALFPVFSTRFVECQQIDKKSCEKLHIRSVGWCFISSSTRSRAAPTHQLLLPASFWTAYYQQQQSGTPLPENRTKTNLIKKAHSPANILASTSGKLGTACILDLILKEEGRGVMGSTPPLLLSTSHKAVNGYFCPQEWFQMFLFFKCSLSTFLKNVVVGDGRALSWLDSGARTVRSTAPKSIRSQNSYR